MTLQLRAGTDWSVEAQADEILAKYRRTCTTTEEKTEFYTEGQMKLRWDREVYNSFGTADGSLFSGQYNREFNPELGQRPSRHRRLDD